MIGSYRFLEIKEVRGTGVDFVTVFETGPDESVPRLVLKEGAKGFTLFLSVFVAVPE